jgi:LmbE family N-acetylglucosaminyl deacetylase
LGLKLMCITAHPDDECFAFGGALALAAKRGIETSVICLTDGQAASNRGDAASAAALGQMRRNEFFASCKVLGITHAEILDYQDGQLEHVDLSHAAGRLVEKIRSFQPDVLLTFGGDGGLNTHPDHAMASFLATAAFHWAGQTKRYPTLGEPFRAKRLYYVTANFQLPDRPPAMSAPWTVTLDISSVRNQKTEAFRQHVSQAPLMERTKEFFAKHGTHEYYVLVATAEPQPARQQTDLFEVL